MPRALGLLLLAACTVGAPEPLAAPGRGPAAAGEASADLAGEAVDARSRPPWAAVASCPIVDAPSTPIELRGAVHVADLAGIRWLVARTGDAGSPTPVLVHLGPAGALALTPLPFWSERVAVEGPSALRFVDDGGSRWFRVDLGDPDAPVVGAAAAVAGLRPTAKGIGSDGAVVAFSRYFRDEAAGEYIGESFLVDVASARPRGVPGPYTAWDLRCRGGRCFGLATPNHEDRRALVELRDEGVVRLRDLGPWQCSGGTSWEAEGRWLLAWSEPEAVGLAAVDLAGGEVRVGSLATPGEACPVPRHLRLGGADLIAVSAGQGPLRLHPISPALAVGEGARLPDSSERERLLAPLGDGLVVAEFTAERGMIHSPTDARGIRRYYHVWSFTGRAGFLARGPEGWALEGPVTLPESGSEGDFATGYRVELLTRPGAAAALVLGDAGLGSYFTPLRRPCAG